MNRRNFMKTSAILGSGSVLMPTYLFGKDYSESYKKITFNETLYNNNSQNIVIFLYGGASELAGNLSNFEDIQSMSENKYSNIEITENGFWKRAGGELMEAMLVSKNMSIVRTINRTINNTRSHGLQQMENLKGANDIEKAGFFREILEILYQNGKLDVSTVIPAITLGESAIYDNGNLIPNALLNPISINSKLENPFDFENDYHLEKVSESFYSLIERNVNQNKSNAYLTKMGGHFFKRNELSAFINDISQKTIPIPFENNVISDSLSSNLKLMLNNKSTKLAFIKHPVGWDDHSNALNQYSNRHNELIVAIDKSIQNLKALENKTINIWVMTEFGRNVNLNDSGGWDHGNQFNLMVFSNNDTLKMGKIIGETEIYGEDGTRLYTRPKENSVSYEPYAIASTIAKLYGIENFEEINGQSAIDTLI